MDQSQELSVWNFSLLELELVESSLLELELVESSLVELEEIELDHVDVDLDVELEVHAFELLLLYAEHVWDPAVYGLYFSWAVPACRHPALRDRVDYVH